MRIGVSNRVVARNAIGQFASACSAAGTATVKEAIEEGANMSRAIAPVGIKPDPRTVPLKESITAEMTGSTSGHWFSVARHALPTEFGGAPHEIVGSPGLRFFWDREGRMFEPASVYYGQPDMVTIVEHPGNPAQPFLRPAYEAVMGKIMQIAKRNYPG